MECSILKNNDFSILLGPDYVPEGNYNVCLREIDLYLTKDNDHHYIMANFEIIDGMFSGRVIKQIWSFRRGQEYRTSNRINNFISKLTSERIDATDNTIHSLFGAIKQKMLNERFSAWLIKNTDNRSEILYAESHII